MWNTGCCGDARGAGRGWRAFGIDPDLSGLIWKFGQHRGGRAFSGGRLFDQGDLKLVILELLAERPRHGYDVIKALEEKSGGMYQASAGTVYPTLTLLEEMGFARSTADASGKRIYEITDEGRAHLTEHRPTVDDILERIAKVGAGLTSDAMMGVHQAFKDVARATYANAMRHSDDAPLLQGIADALRQAARDIEAKVSPGK